MGNGARVKEYKGEKAARPRSGSAEVGSSSSKVSRLMRAAESWEEGGSFRLRFASGGYPLRCFAKSAQMIHYTVVARDSGEEKCAKSAQVPQNTRVECEFVNEESG